MYQPFAATAAPISYNGSQQTAPAAYMNQQPAYGTPIPPMYGMLAYPSGPNAVYPGTAVYGNQQQQQQHGGATYSGLDAAVYSAASAMLVERGIAPQQKTYNHATSANQNISGYPSGNLNSTWNRIEAMNPTTSVSASSGSGRGGARSVRNGGGGGGRAGRGGGRGGYGGRYGQEKPKDPANQTVHYCEVCKVSCAGQVSFQAHVIGSKHKKREEQLKWENEKGGAATSEGSQVQPPVNSQRMSNFSRATQKCELCGVMTAGAAAYDAHIKGKAHQRTLKLHMSLGKPIPVNEPTVIQRTVDTTNPRLGASKPELATGSSICTKVVTGGKTVLITPKMNFVGGTVLHTTENGMQETAAADGATVAAAPSDGVVPTGQEGAAPAAGSTRKALKKNSTAVRHDVNPTTTQEPIGENYIQKTEKSGKVAYYKCTLCECEFSDDSGMNSHIRGRRHRLSYQKKVDPSIVVDMPNSLKKVKALQEARSSRGGRGGGRGGVQVAARGKRPAPGGPFAGPPGPKRMAYSPHSAPSGPWAGPPSYAGPSQPLLESYGPSQYGGSPRPQGGLLPSPAFGGHRAPYYPPPHRQGPLFQPLHQSSMQQPLPFDQDACFEEDSSASQGKHQSPGKQAPRLDQQYLLQKHRQVVPPAKDVESLQKTVTIIEKALKNLIEKLMIPIVETLTDVVREIPTEGVPEAVTTVKPAQKMLKGSFRFGALTKSLLTKDNVFGEILLISTRHPSAEDLDTVAEALQTELKVVCPSISYAVVAYADQCGIFVKALEPELPANGVVSDTTAVPSSEIVQSEASFPVWIYLAYGSLRDELFKANAEETTANGDGSPEEAGSSGSIGATTVPPVSPQGEAANTATAVTLATAATPPSTSTAQTPAVPMENAHLTSAAAAAGNQSAVDVFSNGLDLKRSLTVLAQSRRTRWFQEFINFFPQCRMLMRILNQVCDSDDDLRLLVGWPIEYLTITTLRIQAAYHGVTPFDIPLPEAFWMILSNIAGGIFLPGCPNGFKDPCERGNLDILGSATLDERVRVTKAVSDLIAQWLSGDYAKVLAVEPLPGDPLYQMEVTDNGAVAVEETVVEKNNGVEVEVATEVASTEVTSAGDAVDGLTEN